MKKKIVSLFLAAILLCATFPAGVFADSESNLLVGYLDYDNGRFFDNVATEITEITEGKGYPAGWYLLSGKKELGRIQFNGDAHLILEDKADITVKGGILVNGCSLTIYAQSYGPNMGKLNVINVGRGSAGIGAGVGGGNCGFITINGGRISADGGTEGAGIGAAYGHNCSTVRINGGIVTANGGSYAAGIGSGYRKGCWLVEINGGTVAAYGGTAGAGIGSGNNIDSNTIININGGSIFACGGENAAGIGCADYGWIDSINIKGGSIKAQAGYASKGTVSTIGHAHTAYPKSISFGDCKVIDKDGYKYVNCEPMPAQKLSCTESERDAYFIDYENNLYYTSFPFSYENLIGDKDAFDSWCITPALGHIDENLDGVCERCNVKLYEPLGGRGTFSDPFTIDTYEELVFLKDTINNDPFMGIHFEDKYYCLTNDIDTALTEPIGIDSKHAFSGIFDGAGHSIKLAINGDTNAGLFGYVKDAEIKNLVVTGSVSATGDVAGGIVGYADGITRVTNCINEASVKANSYVGGIIGKAQSSTAVAISIINCLNYGSILAPSSGSFAGGIAGSIGLGGKIENCFTSAVVSETNSSGVITGAEQKQFGTKNCFYQILDANNGMEPMVNDSVNHSSIGVEKADDEDMLATLNAYASENALSGWAATNGKADLTFAAPLLILGEGTLDTGLTWELDTYQHLTISGTGEMPDYDYASDNEAPWAHYTIKSVTIEDGVENIGNDAFVFQSHISDVKIGSGVRSIGRNAFDSVELNSLTYNGSKSQWANIAIDSTNEILSEVPIQYLKYDVEYDANGGTGAPQAQFKLMGKPLRLTTAIPSKEGFTFVGWALTPDATNAQYTPGSNYKVDADVTMYAVWGTGIFGDCGDNLTWSLDDGVLTIDGEGDMALFGIYGAPWYAYKESIKSVIIGDAVTNIRSYAFIDCTSLETVSIGSSVAGIYGYAFKNCSSLESVELPDSVTGIGNNAFEGCSSLKEITIGSGMQQIQSSAFLSTGLTDVFYNGTEDQWNAISIGRNNDPLNGAEKHYLDVDNEELSEPEDIGEPEDVGEPEGIGNEGSFISQGTLWIIIAIAVLAIAGGIIAAKKKKS